MKDKYERMSQDELDKLCESIHDKQEDKKLGKAKLTLSSWSGVTFGNPRPGCKKCFGRGYIGKDTETGQPIMCLCSRNRPMPERQVKPTPPLAPRIESNQLPLNPHNHKCGPVAGEYID